MREPNLCAEVRKRLALHGLPPEQIERVTRELADHWEDLHAAGLQEGLPAWEAAAQADNRLGPADQLAADVLAGLRRCSWFGRHPLIGLCVVPLLLQPLLMFALALPLYWISKVTGFAPWAEPGSQPDAELIVGTVWVLYYITLVVSLVWLCWRGWTAGLGLRWVVAACSWCALAALARFFDADPVQRHLAIGLGFPWRLNSHTVVILLLHVLAAGWFMLAVRKARTMRLAK